MIRRRPHIVTPAEAIADDLGPSIHGQGRWYRITVRAAPWYRGLNQGQRRVYEIAAHDVSVAAYAGLRRFEEELDGVHLSAVH